MLSSDQTADVGESPAVGGDILERLNKQSVPFPHDFTELSSYKLL
jgi:hypothetical protein